MEPVPHRLLGRILVDLGYVKVNELHEALRLQMTGKDKRRLGEILIEQGWLTRDRLSEALAIQIKEDWGRGGRGVAGCDPRDKRSRMTHGLIRAGAGGERGEIPPPP